MIIALLRRHTFDLIFQILGIHRLLLLIAFSNHLVNLRQFLIWEILIGEKDLVDNPVEHASAEDAGEVFFVLFRPLTREYPDEFTASIVLLNCLVNDFSKLQQATLSEQFVMIAELLRELLYDPVNYLIDLGVQLVA